MSLSSHSFEILSDLLALRMEAFLVTSTDEARELKMLRQCQRELANLHTMGRQMAAEMGVSHALPAPADAPAKPAPKISRRLQRLVARVQEQESRAG